MGNPLEAVAGTLANRSVGKKAIEEFKGQSFVAGLSRGRCNCGRTVNFELLIHLGAVIFKLPVGLDEICSNIPATTIQLVHQLSSSHPYILRRSLDNLS